MEQRGGLAMQLANVDDLAEVVGVVGADVRDPGGPFGDFGVVGGFHGLLPVGHYFVQLLHGDGPAFGVETVEGFVVVATEFRGLLAFKFRERLSIPENQVIGELTDGVIAALVRPGSLFRRQALDGNVGGDKPIFDVVRGAELLEQDGLERRGFFVLRVRGNGEQKNQDDKDLFHTVCLPHLRRPGDATGPACGAVYVAAKNFTTAGAANTETGEWRV